MTKSKTAVGEIAVRGAPAIPGMRSRHFRGDDDYAEFIAVNESSASCDPANGVLVVEGDARVIGYIRRQRWTVFGECLPP